MKRYKITKDADMPAPNWLADRITVLGRTPSNPDGGKPENTFETLVNNADNMTAEEVAAQFEALAKQ